MEVKKDTELLKRHKLSKEAMEMEIEYRSYRDPSEEFPADEIAKTLDQLGLTRTRGNTDGGNSRNAPQ